MCNYDRSQIGNIVSLVNKHARYSEYFMDMMSYEDETINLYFGKLLL